MKNISAFEKRLVLLLILLIIISGAYFHALWVQDAKNTAYLKEAEKQEALAQKLQSTFGNVALRAHSAFVVDLSSRRVLYDISSSEKMPLASITKVMTAMITLENLGANTKIPISKESMSEEGDEGLLSGETWSRDDLIKFTLIASSNDGARALAMETEEVLDKDHSEKNKLTPKFIEKMNAKAKELRMRDTTFYNPTGLDISKTKPGAIGTAKDVATMMQYAITAYPEIFRDTTRPEVSFQSNKKGHIAINTNHAIPELSDLIASKTGMTNLAGGNLAIAFEPITGHTIIAVVLGSSTEGRFLDIEQLAKSSKEVVDSL